MVTNRKERKGKRQTKQRNGFALWKLETNNFNQTKFPLSLNLLKKKHLGSFPSQPLSLLSNPYTSTCRFIPTHPSFYHTPVSYLPLSVPSPPTTRSNLISDQRRRFNAVMVVPSISAPAAAAASVTVGDRTFIHLWLRGWNFFLL